MSLSVFPKKKDNKLILFWWQTVPYRIPICSYPDNLVGFVLDLTAIVRVFFQFSYDVFLFSGQIL